MTSDLKPRQVKARKTLNIKFYAALSLLILITYIFFMSASSEAQNEVNILKKTASAASQITKGMSGTAKEREQIDKKSESNAKLGKSATAQDVETHNLVHDMKALSEESLATGAGATEDVMIPSKDKPKEKHVGTSHKDMHKGKAFDAQDALKVLMDTYDIIIFSKTYCPHSKRAKDLLQTKYDIRPKPLVFELDVEDHGADLQVQLFTATGRRTVPNIIVHGKSIGGADEITTLHDQGKLVAKIRELTTVSDVSVVKK